ncbi:hypothetical protein GOP47_0017146 [Adiantum capillus-veneris]|uniref:EF-hand domain-containing protein n=1 Tax=Adiantum capillus-veneris TaxID=13818 RepID=A0A9D4ZDN8_ADICA|nr:hypothetical protein GOP47_0017146 [Adiantum capillus-veneris]
MSDPEPIPLQKVRRIFTYFDANQDGGLSREEMATLVVAVNPRVKFSTQQVDAILDEVFRTYQDFIQGPEGLSFDGLLRTYEDGAGDVDRDFEALKLVLDSNKSVGTTSTMVPSITDERVTVARLARRTDHMPVWAPSNIVYDSSWCLVEDLLIIIKRLEARMGNVLSKLRDRKVLASESFGSSEASWSIESTPKVGVSNPPWEELGEDYDDFCHELAEITQKADGLSTADEVLDALIAIGWTLFDHALYREALASFMKARDCKALDARPHFHLGNTLYRLGRYDEARDCYTSSLDAAEAADNPWRHLVPQINVNLGITLEADGMLLSACENYKKATRLSPKHYRALKLLGSALYGVGQYRAAERALSEATSLKPDFADAHCDLGLTVHAIGEDDERAIREFQLAVDLKPDHVEALYNLGGLFKDIGRYRRAAEMYSKVLTLQPNNWRAQLNKGVTLLGAGETEEARKAIKEAFKMNNRVELYDAIMHLKLAGKRPRGLCDAIKQVDGDASPIGKSLVEGAEGGVMVVETSCFRQANKLTTPCQWLFHALDIRCFQRHTRLSRCSVYDLKKKLEESKLPASSSVCKDKLEDLLRKLLHFLKPDTFQGSVKAINERILSVLDQAGVGQVDVGMFCAMLAPLCAGHIEKRKRVAFDFLLERASKGTIKAELSRADASMYMKILRAIYMPQQGVSQITELHGEAEQGTITISDFEALFDDPDWGFGILDVVVKLEASDRVRHDGQICTVCSYPITGPWFKEVTSNFSLCSLCYSECKVPISAKKNEYCFKEYNSEAEVIKDKFWFLNLWSSSV